LLCATVLINLLTYYTLSEELSRRAEQVLTNNGRDALHYCWRWHTENKMLEWLSL